MAFSNIDKPSKYFDITLFTGDNASGRTFTGLNFAPDMIWGKSRDTANLNHQIVDIVRGGTKFLFTNSTLAEDTASHGQITSWNSDGTTWADGTNGTYPRLYYNDNGQLGGSGSRVWWQWKANGTGVSNTAGTISSTVSANTTSGFSIVSYTGNGSSSATVGHGLGVTPSMIICKGSSYANSWFVYHKSLSANNFVYLNYDDAQANANTTGGGCLSTSPTSSTFGFQSGTSSVNNVNTNGNTYIAYCFAEVKGFSKAFSYTGNGSTDGTYVNLGFRPAWVLLKKTDAVSEWSLFDNKRSSSSGSNLVDYVLTPNEISAEIAGSSSSSRQIDLLSNGFKFRTTSNGINASGGTYIGFAIAENPFVSSKGIAVTAR